MAMRHGVGRGLMPDTPAKIKRTYKGGSSVEIELTDKVPEVLVSALLATKRRAGSIPKKPRRGVPAESKRTEAPRKEAIAYLRSIGFQQPLSLSRYNSKRLFRWAVEKGWDAPGKV